jgi:lysophospholipase L1-like esterase
MRVLCYGDSNTIGFCESGRRYQPYGKALSDALAAAQTPAEVTACGLCGLTAKEMDEGRAESVLEPRCGPHGKGLERLLKDDGPWDLVVIMAGTNDLGAGAEIGRTQVHVARIHALCHDHGVPTVNVAPPSSISIVHMAQERRRLADLMGTWARATPDVLFHVDSEEIIPRSATGMYEPDEIHFSARGSDELGRLLAPKIAAVLGQAPLSPRAHSVSVSPALHRPASPVNVSPALQRPASPDMGSPVVVRGPSPGCRSRSPLLRQIPEVVVGSVGTDVKVTKACLDLSSKIVQPDRILQDKRMERAVITLQKLQREKRVQLQSPSVVGRSVAVGKLQTTCATSVLALPLQSKVSTLGCVV